jgi:drug/metabolite transporter (DMT)-like permease
MPHWDVQHDPKQSNGLLWVALGSSLWGTDTVLRRPLTGAFSSVQIVLLEHLILTAVLLPVWWRALRGLSRRQWAAILGIAWGGSALGTLFFTESIRIGNPTTTVLLQKTQPIVAVVLASIILRERFGGRRWLWLAVALAGTYLVSFGAVPPGRLVGGARLAALLALGAAALWGASTVLGRFLLQEIAFPSLTALRIVVAFPLLLVLAWLRPHAWPAVTANQVLFLVTLSLVPGLAALLIYYRGLRQTRASLAAVAELCFPATAALLNWIAFGAGVSKVQAGGFILLWIAILAIRRES